MKNKMFKFFLFFQFIFIIFSCDIQKPTSSLNSVGRNLASWNHGKFSAQKCSTCHEKTRPIAINAKRHGSGSDCKSCHTYKKSGGVASWKNIIGFNHSGTINNCKSCHNNKRPDTIPHKVNQPGEKRDCSSCHLPGNWKKASFNHSSYVGKCNICHGVVGGSPTLNDKPIPKNQHPSNFYSGIDCINCHTPGLGKWRATSFDQRTHLPNPTTCMNCHDKKRPTAQNSSTGLDHSPGDCVFCHTSKTDWRTGIIAFDHEARTPNSCLSCHSNKKPIPADQHPSLNIKYKNLDCILCHTYSKVVSPRNWNKIIFNDSTHLPTPVSCLSCHKSIVSDSRPSSGSHNNGSRSRATCKSCHKFEINNPIAFKNKSWTNFASIQSIHLSAQADKCSSCHNRSQNLIVKEPVGHISSILDCNSCHRSNLPMSWRPVTMTHSSGDTNCKSCHNGTQARGKTPSHIPSTVQCSVCHTKTAWRPARMVHSSGDTNCKSCHNGSQARGKTPNHLSTVSQCSVCHTQSAWLPATGGRPANHFKTTQSLTQNCIFCHKTPQTTMKLPNFFTTYVHSQVGRYPGDHRFGKTCIRCHQSNSDGVRWQNYNFVGSCAACHAAQFDPSEGDHRPGGVGANRMCNDCHQHNLRTGSF